MPKQMIEIDVPEGMEIDTVHEVLPSRFSCDYTVQFKKKEPKYIEVREYLITTHDGVTVHHSAQKGISNIKLIEESTNFMRWIDKDWRNVKI